MKYFQRNIDSDCVTFSYGLFNYCHKNVVDKKLTGDHMTKCLSIPYQYEKAYEETKGDSEMAIGDNHKVAMKTAVKIFVEALDKYYLHFIEELVEFQTEVNKSDEGNEYEMIEELCDILLYADSILSFLKEAQNDISQMLNIEYKITIPQCLVIEIPTFPLAKGIPDFIMNGIMMPMINARREFPERKWHKEHISTDTETISHVYNSFKLVETAVMGIIKLFVHLDKCDMYTSDFGSMDYILYNKQATISNKEEFQKAFTIYNNLTKE